MKEILSWLFFIALLIALGFGLVALSNQAFNDHRPLWTGPVAMIAMAIGTSLISYARKKGWITSGFWSTPKVLEDRKAALAAQRNTIIAEAKARK